MNICIDCRFLYASGLGRYIREIVIRLIQSQKNWPFYLICKNQNDFEVLAGSNANARLIISDTGMYSIKEQFELPFKIPEVDIFWSPHYPVPIFGTKAQIQVVTILDVNHLVFIKDLSFLQQVYAKLMMFASTRKSHYIITISKFSKNEIAKYTGISAPKIHPFYIGIDKSIFKIYADSPQRVQLIKTKYNLTNDYILFVGNVKPHKNIIGLLKAFQILNKWLPKVQLIITGRKDKLINGVPGLSSLLRELELEQVVHFTGFVDEEDLPRLYNFASVFVFASFYEGFGLPPLEAMACGCPVVVSNSSCFPEICGNAAYFVDPHSSEDIANGLHAVLTDKNLRENLIKKGFDRVQYFNWDTTVKEIVQLFNDIKEKNKL